MDFEAGKIVHLGGWTEKMQETAKLCKTMGGMCRWKGEHKEQNGRLGKKGHKRASFI